MVAHVEGVEWKERKAGMADSMDGVGWRGARRLRVKAGARSWVVRAIARRPDNMAAGVLLVASKSRNCRNRKVYLVHIPPPNTTRGWLCFHLIKIAFKRLLLALLKMAPATSSRRRVTRRNDMSDIEEDHTPLNTTKDDVEESDGEPASRRVKKEKGKGRAQQDRGDNGPDSDLDEAIDVEDFPDQPLKREQMSKLLGMADDWEKLAEVVGRPFGTFGMSAGALADLDDEDAKEVQMHSHCFCVWAHLTLLFNRK